MLVWAHAGLLAARNIPLFMIVAAPPVAAAVQEWLALLPEWNVAGVAAAARPGRFNRVAAETAETEAIGRWHLVSVGGLAAGGRLDLRPASAQAVPRRVRSRSTIRPAPWRRCASDPAARIFTHDEWGDYLIWSLYPGHKVFVDGRSDFYGDDFEEEVSGRHEREVRLGEDPRPIRRQHDFTAPDTPLAGALKESSRWRVVYDDGIALVFRPAGAVAQQTRFRHHYREAEISRDREITKTLTRDPAITETN